MYLEERIEILEERLQSALLPAIYFKKLQDKIYKQLLESDFLHNESPHGDGHKLPEGNTCLDFQTIHQMLFECSKYGDYFIFLCGSKLFMDCCYMDNDKLSSMNIKCLLENRLPNDIAYLIPVRNDSISGEPVKIKREMKIFKGAKS